jgi:C_GCAxxG_C_C family probable redox protein
MKEENIKKMVYRNYNEGFHCAESIANTINELFPEKSDISCNAASGFCGGIGGCKQDICGALSGGIISLGLIYGRQKGGTDISKLISLSAELRQLFIEKFKTTVCKDVIENLKDMQDYNDCKDLTAKTTWMLYNLIKNNTF